MNICIDARYLAAVAIFFAMLIYSVYLIHKIDA